MLPAKVLQYTAIQSIEKVTVYKRPSHSGLFKIRVVRAKVFSIKYALQTEFVDSYTDGEDYSLAVPVHCRHIRIAFPLHSIIPRIESGIQLQFRNMTDSTRATNV